MRNDTPDNGSDDSQPPFISEGNDDGVSSVAEDMMDHNDTPPTEAPESAERPGAIGIADTGEMAPIDRSIQPSVVEAAPFDYDTYYGTEPIWPDESLGEPPAEARTPKTRDGAMYFIGAIAAGVVGAALTVGVLAATGTFNDEGPALAVPPTQEAVTSTEAPSDSPAPINNTIINNELGSAVNPTAVAVKTIPSIVTVNTFSGEGESAVGVGSGSGVVLTSDGYIATNEHVVDGAANYAVTFEDGRVYEAELVGQDALTDLAVLKITADGLVPIEFGSSDVLALGDPAVAVGNPLGQDGGSSISVGIVSAFDRQVDFGDGSSLFGMIQTDAAINSGSSGGALVNADGQLIGITSAIGVSNAGPEGIGYAIPVELVERITDEIIEIGDVNHPFLGVTVGTFLEEKADGAIQPSGAEIIGIEGDDSAAAAAGIEEGDVVVMIGDKEISTRNDLILEVRLYRVGDVVEFGVLRNGEPLRFSVEMGQRPSALGG